jgi:hypothetical protein
MRSPLLLTAALALAAPAYARPQESAAVVHDARVWIGHAAEFEEFLKTAPIERIEDVGMGVTNPERAFFAKGGLAESAVVKHLKPGLRMGYWESFKSEIAAYLLDRLLGLDMVPVTVERRVGVDLASVQLWVEGCRLLKGVDQSSCPRPEEWARSACRQRVFDNLIANIDRNAGNILIDDEWHMILIDHSRAFASNRLPFEKEMTRIDRPFFEKLKALDEATLMPALKDWVPSKGSVRDILKRRDRIVADFEKLVREKGEAAVFPF